MEKIFPSFILKTKLEYIKDNTERLFIECIRCDLSNLNVVTLPKGKYISISSKENEKDEVINKLKDFVFKKYNFVPNEIVVLVKVIEITKWHYVIQTKVE